MAYRVSIGCSSVCVTVLHLSVCLSVCMDSAVYCYSGAGVVCRLVAVRWYLHVSCESLCNGPASVCLSVCLSVCPCVWTVRSIATAVLAWSVGWSQYAGIYVCRVSNGYSSDQRFINISVSDAPRHGPLTYLLYTHTRLTTLCPGLPG